MLRPLLLLLLLASGCSAGFVTPSNDGPVTIPDDDDSAADDDDTTVGDDDDTTVGDDDDTTVGDDDDIGDDDDSTPGPTPVRFVAMGDTGEGNADQATVAAAIETLCAAQGCDFVLLLGDNFYDVGVEDVNDTL